MLKKIILVLLVVSSLFASEIKWAKSYSEGMKEATKVNKPVLLVSSRHTCKYCVILKNTTFQDKKVIEFLNRDFIAIIAYSDDNDYMPQELFTPGVPALWFLFPNGQPMYQPLMGAVTPLNFLEALTIVKEEFNKVKVATK